MNATYTLSNETALYGMFGKVLRLSTSASLVPNVLNMFVMAAPPVTSN